MSELDDINLEIEKSKVNKISKEEYYEIYLKLIEIYKKIQYGKIIINITLKYYK